MSKKRVFQLKDIKPGDHIKFGPYVQECAQNFQAARWTEWLEDGMPRTGQSYANLHDRQQRGHNIIHVESGLPLAKDYARVRGVRN